MSNLIDFEVLAQGLAAAGVAHSPSELQGVLAGLLATGHGGQDQEVLGVLAAHADRASRKLSPTWQRSARWRPRKTTAMKRKTCSSRWPSTAGWRR